MARAPLHQLTKPQIMRLYKWRCKHGHDGISHYGCWTEAQGRPERLAFLDLECSGLVADFAIMLSWCIKPSDSDEIIWDCITKQDLAKPTLDKRIVQSLIQEMLKYDRVVGHYSSKFDCPFARSRALAWKLKFPTYQQLVQSDTWRMARTLLKISSNRQDNVSRFLFGKSIKTRIESKYWIAALQGNRKALDYILDHNKRDVIQLEANYRKLEPYARKSATSI